ncbi:MAG: tetratricopeptide repeat protein, partial [Bacteroidales bacterium]|nr:tetratricopeptide repeat protein [Candidatus Latescibacterota bacterium]
MSETNSGRPGTFSIITRSSMIVALVVVALTLMALGSPAGAEKTKIDARAMNLINSGGRELEGARLRSNDDLRAVSEEMLGKLETIRTGGIRDDVLAGIFMLRGEALFITEDYFGAEESFRRAEKLYRKGVFPDDAMYLRIRSLESAGEETQAATLWKKWSELYEAGPLDAEAQMGAIWNMIRREEFGAASVALVSLKKKYQWMAGDPGLMLAEASVRYYREDFAGAFSIMERMKVERLESEGSTFLSAMSREKMGDEFGAARDYHRFVREFPSSDLAGYASLAKANIMSSREDYLSAAASFHRLAERSGRDDIRNEALLLEAMSEFLGGRIEHGMALMRNVAGYDHSENPTDQIDTSSSSGESEDIKARARFALGEMNWWLGRFEDAVIDFNLVLSEHFDHGLAGSALYRSARCVDALGRHAEANSTYQAVASGYPYASEAPAAVYLAGVGLLEQGLPLAAAPYFQLIMDRYWGEDVEGTYVFNNSEHQELAEAALCLLEYSYHQTGDMGQLSGAPHLVLHRMPPSSSRWRAWALLLDADALAEQARYPEAQETLAKLFREFPDDNVGIKANRLLAWTYSRQGREDLAIKTEERLLARYRAQDDWGNMSAASLTLAHAWFNRKDYVEAGRRYSGFMNDYPDHPEYRIALYQYG